MTDDYIVEITLPPVYDNEFLLNVVYAINDLGYQVKFVPAPKIINIPPAYVGKPQYPYVTYNTNSISHSSDASAESIKSLRDRLKQYKEDNT